MVLSKVTYGDNPKTQIAKQELGKVKCYILADPGFGTPGEIDLLVGVPILNKIARRESHCWQHDSHQYDTGMDRVWNCKSGKVAPNDATGNSQSQHHRTNI